MNIELTQEQAEAFGRGESITLTPKPKQWEPRGGSYWVNHAHISTYTRLLQYVTEFGGDWGADWGSWSQEKCYVSYGHHSSNKTHSSDASYNWDYLVSNKTRTIGTVYMSRKCAIALAAKLNSGEVIL